jgi:hypothetical protein
MVIQLGSIKSGPFLKGCTTMPALLKAAKSPNVTVVFPDLPLGAPTTRRGIFFLSNSIFTPPTQARKSLTVSGDKIIGT